MAETTNDPALDITDGTTGKVAEAPATRPRWRMVVRTILLAFLTLAAALTAGLWWLSETRDGRAFLAARIADVRLESGIRIHIARIDGSLFSSFDLVGVGIDDLDGRLIEIPVAHIDWKPLSLLRKRVNIHRVDVPILRLLRMWNINPADPDDPLLPDINMRIGRFDLHRLMIEKPVLGQREIVRSSGLIDIRRGRLLVDMEADSTAADRLLLLIDAEPDGDRFDLKADVTGPAGGLLAKSAGIDGPLRLVASGSGLWSGWQGQFVADVGAGQTGNIGAEADGRTRVADLKLFMDKGQFRLVGDVKPQPFLPESLHQLADPAIRLELGVSGKDQLFDVRLDAASKAFQLAGGGGIDARRNRAKAVQLTASLLRPDTLHPDLSGDGVQATLAADGALFGDPLTWTATARKLRFTGENGELMGADGLAASGTVALASGKTPLTAAFDVRLAQLVGLPDAAAELLARPQLTGNIRQGDDGSLHLQAAKLTTAALELLANGRMADDGTATAALDARLRNYAAPGAGPVAASAKAQLSWHPDHGPGADGSFEARTLTLADASPAAADFLGGNPRLNGRFSLGRDGVFHITTADLISPALKFRGMSASYVLESGIFSADAAGESKAWGAITISAGGMVDAPFADLHVERPDFGFGLADLTAHITPRDGGGITLVATGVSPEGDLDLRTGLLYGAGQPLTADIEHVRLAGVSARGRLVQTDSGPFAGRLVAGGRGLQAKIDLSAAGARQRADLLATASRARLPLDPAITINKGSAQLSILFVPGKPEISGSFRGSGITRDTLVLSEIEGAANLVGFGGEARVKMAGKAGRAMPFAATSSVRSVGEGYAITLDGTIGKQKLGLHKPAQIVREDRQWRLRAARLDLPKGHVDLAGRIGREMDLDIRLHDVDLGIAEIVPAGSGMGGTANGRLKIHYAGGRRLPTGAVDLTISGLSRAGITGFTIPTDVRLSGNSDGELLLLGGRMSYQQQQLGRLVVRVDPGEGETPGDRFMAGALSGGVRFNGPVEPLWAFVQMEGQELRGSLAIGADLGGSPADPNVRGTVRGRNLLYRNALLGSELTNMELEGSFTGSSFELERFEGDAQGGRLSGSGFVHLAADAEQQLNLKLELSQARLANSDMIDLTMSGPLTLVGRMNEATLAGDLKVDEARIQIVQLENSDIPQIRVRRAGESLQPDSDVDRLADNLKLNLRVRADNIIRVEGMGLDSFWRADVRVRGSAADPRIFGNATLDRGEFEFASSDFEITRGRIVFNGQPLDSSLDVQAQTQAADVLAVLNIVGTVMRPELRFSSTPSLPEDEILSRLLFGTSVADLSVTEAVQLATAVAGLQSGVDTMGKIRRSVGLDRLRLVGDDGDGMGTGLAVGKRLTRNVYAEVITDSQGNTLTSLQLTLSRLWSLFLDVSSLGRTSANIRHQREY